MVLYFGTVLGAVVTKDIGVVFEYIGAFGFTMFSFILPGLFYIILFEKNATEEQKSKDGNKLKYVSYMMIGLGFVNMILVIIKTIAGPSEENPDEDPVEGPQMLGYGIPSFLVLNSPGA